MRSSLFIACFSLLTIGCTDDSTHTQAALQAAPDPAAQYRVVLSLASFGSGIDQHAYDQIFAAYGAHDIDLSPDVYEWGLEGERNLCFPLDGLNLQAQGLLVDDMKSIAASAQLVTVHENAPCDVMAP